MARIIGIDLGARSAKVAVLRAGFRGATIASVQTFEVLPGGASALERSLDALAGLGAVDPHDAVGVAVPGDRVVMRVFDIPFSDPKKLTPIVANELADDIPWDVEDVVFDHGGLPGLNKVVAAAVRSAEIGRLIDKLQERGIDPRHLHVAPLSYATLVRHAGDVAAPAGETVAVVDIGHARTNVCFVRDGRALMARTISRGGHQLSVALRQALQLSYDEAERLKEQHGVVTTRQGVLNPEQQRIANILGQALTPLAREVRQTLSVLSARLEGPRTSDGERRDAQPARVLLCGGTSLLGGIDEVLTHELGLPTTRLSIAHSEAAADAGLSPEGEAIGALALGAAFESGRRGVLELRQGEYAFKTDRSVFRDKLWAFAGSAVAILICAALSAYASMRSLHKEEAKLKRRLRIETRLVFGKPISSPRQVLKRLKRVSKSGGGFTIPSKTATDVLDMLSRDIPKGGNGAGAGSGDAAGSGSGSGDGSGSGSGAGGGGSAVGAIDITRLDIKPGKTYLKGTADSQSTVGRMVRALKANPCFADVSTGKISSVAKGKKQFTVTMATKCF